MQQSELIQILEIADSTFRGWRSALGITAKKQYTDEEVAKFSALKDAVGAGQRFEDAVRDLGGGNGGCSGNDFSDAIAKGLGKKLTTQADMVGQGLSEAFEEMVWDSFLKHLGKSKGSKFEDLANNFSLSLDANDPMQAFLIEGSDDV
jgi:hypothetical protein